MTPTWLIESEVFPNECEQLISELKRQNVNCVICRFGKTYEEYLKDFYNDDCVVFYGSLQFASLIRRKTNWAGLYCNLSKFQCSYYYPRFKHHLLNDDCMMIPFGNLDRRKDSLFKYMGIEGKMFVRPSSGYKIFTGKIVSIDTWEKDFKFLSFYGIEPEELVVVATPAKIKREWRAVIADQIIIAGSEYHTDNDWNKYMNIATLPDEVWQYVQKVVESTDYHPDPVWTIDVCEIESGDFKVVEVGSFSCAGLYDCDPEIIVKEVNRITIREHNLNR